MDSMDYLQRSLGLKSRINFFKGSLGEKNERITYIEMTENITEKSKIRRRHSEYIRSCFDIVKNENELRTIHEETRKLAIDSFIAAISADDQEKVVIIKQFCEDIDKDFEVLFSAYKTDYKNLNPELNISVKPEIGLVLGTTYNSTCIMNFSFWA